MSVPYRADQVGSFLRPPEILEARRPDSPDHSRLTEIEDQAILRVLAKQKELGFDIFTDGEFRRSNFMGDFTEAIEGVDYGEGLARTWKTQQEDQRPPDARMGPVRGIVTAKLRQVKPLTGHELPFLKQHSPGDIKMTLPSATQFPAIMFKWGTTDKFYRDHSVLLWEIVEMIKAEVAKLAAEGVKYIQIDAPRYSYYMDPKWREWIRTNMKVDPDTALDDAIKADNACFKAARRPGVVLGIHLCRGNSRSHWYAEGGYDPIAEKLFGTMDVDRFLLEYEDPRSGTFAPLRFVPKNRTVVLGLISSKVAKLEDGDEVVRRIHEAAKYVPLENLALSPQCGFASTLEGNLLTEEDQWAKMRLVVETARRVWG
ncbi:MAG TPA: cobalamin-independent methionine synthase II family protein [Candidatus Acidoferrum sp.]|nr:cobalamin-independent methionine synthase II family protein [Candidatus Acidoferrum sp.]